MSTQPKRQSFRVPGIRHGNNPIPSGVKIGGMLFSGGISGQDPESGKVPDSAAEQAALAFGNLQRLLEHAGGSLGDVAHMTVYLKDLGHRELINTEWLKCFPEEDDRPTRHTLKAELQGNVELQLQVIAVVG